MTANIQGNGKSFLRRPEGKIGLVVSGAALAGTGYGLYLVLPALIVLASNLIQLAALCALVGVAIYLIADGRVRAFAAYLYKSFFRLLTGFFIELDPIGILKSHIDELGKKLSLMREQLANLSGQIRRIEGQIRQNSELREHALALAQTGRHQPEHEGASRLQARHAVKLEDSNTRLGSMLQQMQTLFRMLKKLHDTSELVLSDMQNTVEIKARERSSIKAAYSAYRGALSILQGQSEGRELYDRAMEFLNDDYAKKLGEIELFMDFSDSVIRGADLESLAYDARAGERLDAWERRLNESLLGAAPAQRAAALPATTRRAEPPRLAAQNDALDQLLDDAGPSSARPR